jgi:hypothetical protein
MNEPCPYYWYTQYYAATLLEPCAAPLSAGTGGLAEWQCELRSSACAQRSCHAQRRAHTCALREAWPGGAVHGLGSLGLRVSAGTQARGPRARRGLGPAGRGGPAAPAACSVLSARRRKCLRHRAGSPAAARRHARGDRLGGRGCVRARLTSPTRRLCRPRRPNLILRLLML